MRRGKSNGEAEKKKTAESPRDKGSSTKRTSQQSRSTGFVSTVSEQLVKDVASFSFGSPVGSNLHLDPDNTADLDTYSVPGIMSIRWSPTGGYSDSPSSPLNLAARALMTRVRSANSGLRNYDQASLMLYVLAVDSAYLYLAHLKRIYGMMMVTNPLSKYLPEAMVTAAGADYQDVLMNIADFRAYINTYAARLYSLPVPKIPVIDRHQDMSSNIYLDANTSKGQLYVFVPEALYVYGVDPTLVGSLTLTLMPYNSGGWHITDAETSIETMTVAEMKSFGESILNPILITYGEEDFALMGGDILKAYGEEGVYRAVGITEDYSVLPVYDELMLHRIMNSTAYSLTNQLDATSDPTRVQISSNWHITQNVGSAPVSSYLQCLPAVYWETAAIPEPNDFLVNHILNSSSGPMTPDVALECTSFMTIPTATTPSGALTKVDLATIGTEYVTRYFMTYFKFESGAMPVLSQSVSITTCFAQVAAVTDGSITTGDVTSDIRDAVAKLNLMDQFDFHPIIKPFVVVLDATALPNTWTQLDSSSALNLFGDIEDYAVVTPGDLVRIRNIKTLVDFGL